MLNMNDLRPGVVIELDGEPFRILEARHNKRAQRRPVKQTKLKSLTSGRVLEYTFQQSDRIPEADVEKRPVKFLYRTRDEFFFADESGRKLAFSAENLGEQTKWLKKDLPVEVLLFNEEAVSVELPIKVTFRVSEAPPGARGDTVQGGLKDVTLETGAVVKTPLFVKSGDLVEIDTRSGDYVRRVNDPR